MTKTEKLTLEIAIKHGFTFSNDSHFTSYTAARRAITGLIKKGFLVQVDDGNGVEYQPTQAARDFIKYGV
ncbi:hypothetical protein KP12_23 [Klebsiella phage KP12]|uniref:Uncharacterized protein n=1 Tax=Klebsiella phage KP12 TaxID=2923374 RepID=A0A9E6Z318_9CAUD|nr:hypothetical protein KP12_23 [Klebsiella phage KP12]WJJ58565.1 hypothetical protein NDO71_orf199 [Klebsiella phage vB_KpnM_NDO71]